MKTENIGNQLPLTTYSSLVFLLISKLTNELRLHQFLGTCSPQ